MLAHPHRDSNQLREVEGVEHGSYTSTAEFCYRNRQHPDDIYGTPNVAEHGPDPDEFQQGYHGPGLMEEDWLELARQLPDCPPIQEVIDLLGRRDIDIQRDWTPHVDRYADPDIVQGDYWRRQIRQNCLDMDVGDLPLDIRDTLNREQRIMYDTFVGHSQCGSEEQILLHVDGGGGTGKSYMIKVLSSHLQRLAGDRPSPIWRAAPTGVASNQTMGTTLHSPIRLPVDRAFAELSPADTNAVQNKLRDVRYLVIDEKSMLGLRQLSWVDKRLRQVFPGRAADPFGGRSSSSSSSSRVYYARENGSHRAGGYARLSSLLRYSSRPPKRAPLFLPTRLFSSPACLNLLDRPARGPISPSVQHPISSS